MVNKSKIAFLVLILFLNTLYVNNVICQDTNLVCKTDVILDSSDNLKVEIKFYNSNGLYFAISDWHIAIDSTRSGLGFMNFYSHPFISIFPTLNESDGINKNDKFEPFYQNSSTYPIFSLKKTPALVDGDSVKKLTVYLRDTKLKRLLKNNKKWKFALLLPFTDFESKYLLNEIFIYKRYKHNYDKAYSAEGIFKEKDILCKKEITLNIKKEKISNKIKEKHTSSINDFIWSFNASNAPISSYESGLINLIFKNRNFVIIGDLNIEE